MLPPETKRLWEFLKEQPALAGFVLIGGSALALRLNHRISEDLDFACHGPVLPRQKLGSLIVSAAEAGFEFVRQDDEAAIAEFQNGGQDLHDHQQDFVVNGKVKVSFFVLDKGMARVLLPDGHKHLRIAELTELFKTKCLVSALRSKTRDWIDLYLLFKSHGFTARDYRNAFIEAGSEESCDIGLARLCSGVPQRNDEGYKHLLSDAPTIEMMQTHFKSVRDQIETEQATKAFSQRPPSGG